MAKSVLVSIKKPSMGLCRMELMNSFCQVAILFSGFKIQYLLSNKSVCRVMRKAVFSKNYDHINLEKSRKQLELLYKEVILSEPETLHENP